MRRQALKFLLVLGAGNFLDERDRRVVFTCRRLRHLMSLSSFSRAPDFTRAFGRNVVSHEQIFSILSGMRALQTLNLSSIRGFPPEKLCLLLRQHGSRIKR